MKKWFKRFFLFGGGLFLLVLIGAIIEWQIAVNRGKSQLAKIQAALDASEPGWQLDSLTDKRNASLPPDEQNIAVIALKAVNEVPESFNKWEMESLAYEWRSALKPNHLADPKDLADAHEQFKTIAPFVAKLHEIRKHSRGGNRIVIPAANPMGMNLTETQKMREAASKLDWQALLAANDNDPATAIEANRTQLHLRLAIGDEPTMISQLVRIAMIAIAVRSTERTLALTEPKQGLPELQAEFERSLTEKDFFAGLEGERAVIDQMMKDLADGTIGLGAVAGGGGPPAGGIVDQLGSMVTRRYVRANHAKILELMTAARDAMKKQGKERKDAIDAIPVPKTRTISEIYVVLLMPAVEKVLQAQIRSEANLGTIIAAIACERYRQQTGNWPKSLDDISKEILNAVPTDPYVGGPVKFKRTETGIVIFTTGLDGNDDGGQLDASGTKPADCRLCRSWMWRCRRCRRDRDS
jgi:hypothetical protein